MIILLNVKVVHSKLQCANMPNSNSGSAPEGGPWSPDQKFSTSNFENYTRKNAQVATDVQTSCNKSVHKLLTRCIRTACSEFVRTSLEQAVDKL